MVFMCSSLVDIESEPRIYVVREVNKFPYTQKN